MSSDGLGPTLLPTADNRQRTIIRRLPASLFSGRQAEHGSARQQLRDLNSVERRTFSQVVPGDEQRQTATARNTWILADPAYQGVVSAGGGKRRRHVDHRDTGRGSEDFTGLIR